MRVGGWSSPALGGRRPSMGGEVRWILTVGWGFRDLGILGILTGVDRQRRCTWDVSDARRSWSPVAYRR